MTRIRIAGVAVLAVLGACLNLSGTFYYLCSVLDGYSRYLVHWEIRERE